jgi:hypothetical protein
MSSSCVEKRDGSFVDDSGTRTSCRLMLVRGAKRVCIVARGGLAHVVVVLWWPQQTTTMALAAIAMPPTVTVTTMTALVGQRRFPGANWVGPESWLAIPAQAIRAATKHPIAQDRNRA